MTWNLKSWILARSEDLSRSRYFGHSIPLRSAPFRSVLQDSDVPVPDINMLGSGIQRLHASVENEPESGCILRALSPEAAKGTCLNGMPLDRMLEMDRAVLNADVGWCWMLDDVGWCWMMLVAKSQALKVKLSLTQHRFDEWRPHIWPYIFIQHVWETHALKGSVFFHIPLSSSAGRQEMSPHSCGWRLCAGACRSIDLWSLDGTSQWHN